MWLVAETAADALHSLEGVVAAAFVDVDDDVHAPGFRGLARWASRLGSQPLLASTRAYSSC